MAKKVPETARPPQVMYHKIREAHLIESLPDGLDVLRVDKIGCHEITTPPLFEDLKKRGLNFVRNPGNVLAMIDHVSPATDTNTAKQGRLMRSWSREHGIRFMDIGENGVCHALIPELAFIMPGEVGVMGDSHTCTWGAHAAFAFGIGTTDLHIALLCGFITVQKQKVIKVNIRGKLRPNVYAKDIALHTVGIFGKEGAVNSVIEFGGEVIDNLPMSGRRTISNMQIEGGATCGLMPVDMTLIEYLWPALKGKYRNKKQALKVLSAWNSDPDAAYDRMIDIDASEIRPLTTAKYHPSEVVAVDSESVRGKEIDQVFIGSCTNGSIDDFRVAAAMFEAVGQPVAKGVRVIVIPATTHVYRQALKEGLIEIFVKAGCVVESPSCGPCLGMSKGVLAPGERAVATSNRNYNGRMGEGGEVNLASPAVAAYSAMMGCVAVPTEEICRRVNNIVARAEKDKAVPLLPGSALAEQRIDYVALLEQGAEALEIESFSGKPFYLSADDGVTPAEKVDTDQMIPAKYLTEVDIPAFGKHFLEQVVKDGRRADLFRSQIIVAGRKFGDGSSREQAPWAARGAGIRCVIVKGIERIFNKNFLNNGLLSVVLPEEVVDGLFATKPEWIKVEWDTPEGSAGKVFWEEPVSQEARSEEFDLPETAKKIIRAGGALGVAIEMAARYQTEGKM